MKSLHLINNLTSTVITDVIANNKSDEVFEWINDNYIKLSSSESDSKETANFVVVSLLEPSTLGLGC